MVVVEGHSRMEVVVEEERRSHMEVGVEEVGFRSRMEVEVVVVVQLVQLVQLGWLLVGLLVVLGSMQEGRSIHLLEHMDRLAVVLGLGLGLELGLMEHMVELLEKNKKMKFN